MKRREFILAGVLASVGTSTARAHANKPARVGYLSLAPADSDREWLNAFRLGMKELGYVEGTSYTIAVRNADRDINKLAPLAKELAQQGIDVFVVYGAPAAVHAAQAAGGNKIPIVMTVGVDPVRNGLVASLAHPGGNVTGLSDLHAGMVSRRLQMLTEIAPGVKRVAVIFNPKTPHTLPQFDDLKIAARTLRLSLTAMPLENSAPADIERAYAALKERPGALLIIPDGTIGRTEVAAFALKHRLPAIGTVKEWADSGFVLSYGTSFADLWRRSATYVDKILKGAKPGDLPIEQPTKFELVINKKTVKMLGIKIPQSILVQADRVIE